MFSLLATGMPPVVFALGLVIAPPMTVAQPATVVAQATSIEPKRLVLSRGSTMLLQMTSKRPIVRVEVDREDVIQVVPEDSTTIRIIGLKPGIVHLTLRDDLGNVEKKQMGK